MKSIRELLGVDAGQEYNPLLRAGTNEPQAGQRIDAGPTDGGIVTIGETACP